MSIFDRDLSSGFVWSFAFGTVVGYATAYLTGDTTLGIRVIALVTFVGTVVYEMLRSRGKVGSPPD